MTLGALGEGVTSDGDEVRAVARVLAPGSVRSSPPRVPSGTVRRQAALDRFASQPDAPCFLVNAPAGYGKTTILATIAERDERPCAWLSLGPGDDDPTALLAHVLLALDRIDALPDEAFDGLVLSDADLQLVRLPRLVATIAQRRPFLLVLDDVHHLRTSQAKEIVRAIVASVPPGACVAIGTRAATNLGLARARAAGSVVDVEMADLAMSIEEGSRLLRGAGLEVRDDDAQRLVEQTEGWPAALYLCALALRDASPSALGEFGGDDRVVAEYLVDEVLTATEPDQLDFLLRTAILDRLSGALCDAVLDRSDSAAALTALAAGNRLVIPLDRTGEWYRYHHLFQDLLRAELRQREAGAIAALHARASDWFAAHGAIDDAIDHAHAAGDLERVTTLVWSYAPLYVAIGRTASVSGQWLAPLSNSQIAAEPALSIVKAWAAFVDGALDEFPAWLAFGEDAADDLLPDGTPVAAAAALLRALDGRHGVAQMRADAVQAYRGHPTESPYRAIGALLEGAAARLEGDAVPARAALERAVALGELLLPSAHVQGLALLALLAVDAGCWHDASVLADRAVRGVETHHMAERPAASLPLSSAALVAAHEGLTSRASELAKRATWLLAALKNVAPWIGVEARVNLARVDLYLGDVTGAQRSLAQASHMLVSYPQSGTLPDRVARVQRQIDATARPLGLTATPLTAAELRVLRYLPTHLSFAQIADDLFVSRNTVKTQAIAVYRKLEVSSRAEAVERARALGLVDA